MRCKRKLIGLITFSMGIGMMLIFFIPSFGFILALFFIIFGFFQLFM